MMTRETISASPIDDILVEFNKKVEVNVIPGSVKSLYCNGRQWLERQGELMSRGRDKYVPLLISVAESRWGMGQLNLGET